MVQQNSKQQQQQQQRQSTPASGSRAPPVGGTNPNNGNPNSNRNSGSAASNSNANASANSAPNPNGGARPNGPFSASDLNRIVLEYLNKKGYHRTEAMLRAESGRTLTPQNKQSPANTKTGALPEPSTSAPNAERAPGLSVILFHCLLREIPTIRALSPMTN